MIRVACDISFAAPLPGTPEVITGVGRVIKEVLPWLQKLPDLEVTAVGAFGGDWNPVSTSIRAQCWADRLQPRVISMPAFRSRLGFASLLGSIQVDLEARMQLAQQRTPSIGLRLLRKFVQLDVATSLNDTCMDVFYSPFLPPPAGLPSSIPRVVFIHDVYPARFPEFCGPSALGTLQQIMDTLNADRDVVVCNSEFTKLDFCELAAFPPSRVIVAPLAADACFQQIDDAKEIARIKSKYQLSSAPYLLSLANPQPRKNLTTAIEAFRILVSALPAWDGHLVIAGNSKAGWGSDKIGALMQTDPGLGTRIRRIGPIDEADLPVLYSGAQAFLFPSTYEGFGLPVLEAMRCGVPVVCSNTTSLPEVAGDAALLVPPLDTVEIAKALQEVIQNPALCSRLSTAGRLRANLFTWDKTAQKVADALRMAVLSKN